MGHSGSSSAMGKPKGGLRDAPAVESIPKTDEPLRHGVRSNHTISIGDSKIIEADFVHGPLSARKARPTSSILIMLGVGGWQGQPALAGRTPAWPGCFPFAGWPPSQCRLGAPPPPPPSTPNIKIELPYSIEKKNLPGTLFCWSWISGYDLIRD